MADYEIPNISVDVVPVTLNPEKGTLDVVLGRRLYEPFIKEFALPGVLLTPHERLDEAALRALKTKTQIDAEDVVALIDLGTFDNPDRDPRGATVAIAKFAVVKSIPQSETVTSVPINQVASGNYDLPFDHNTIVRAASNLLAEKMLFSKAITKAVLGDVFTTKTLRTILLQLQETNTEGDFIYDASNLTRQLKGTGWVEPAPEAKTVMFATTTTSGRGRPSRRWKWL